MRRSTLLALAALLAAGLLIPAGSASASDVSLNNAVAAKSAKLNRLASKFNTAIGTCNSSQLKRCGGLFKSARQLRTTTIRTLRAVDGERASSGTGRRAKRATLRSLRAQAKSVRSAPAFVRAARKGQRKKARRLQARGNRYGRIAERNARTAKKLFDQIAARR